MDELTQREHMEWQVRETDREESPREHQHLMGALQEEDPVEKTVKTVSEG